MIRHLVLFKLRQEVAATDPRLPAIERMMQELPQKIPQIRDWRFGRNVTPDAEAWDYGLMATFETVADLNAYFDHPAHQPVLAAWNELTTLAFVDFAA